MKKEKTIKTYQRRTRTGKVVTVKQHTAKYDASEALKEAAKKKGAGDELETLKKKKPVEKPEVKKPTDEPNYDFTADEYKAWYHWDQDSDPKNKAALKVEKALKKQMGTKAYNKYFDEMSDGYSARGHNKAFKGLGDIFGGKSSSKKEVKSKESSSANSFKAEVEKRLAQKLKESYVKKRDGKWYYRAKWATKGYDEAELRKKLKKEISHNYRVESDPKYAAASALKGAKAELRGFGSQSASGVASAYGKDSREYKGYTKLAASAVPKDAKKAAVRAAVLQGFGRAGDDTFRDLLVVHGYPHDKAYSEGEKEVASLITKYNMDAGPLRKAVKGKRPRRKT